MKKIIFLYLFFSFPGLATSQDCRKYLSDCEYYSCINQVKNCGERSYFQKTGFKYCEKFSDLRDKFSLNGSLWMEKTKVCLIREIDNLGLAPACKDYKKEALKHHFKCYLSAGYCSLSKADKKLVFKTIRATIWKPSMLKTALRILKSCHKDQ